MEGGEKRKRSEDLSGPLVITYDAPNRTFQRVFKEDSLEAMREVVRKKLRVASGTLVNLSQIRDGRSIDLEDDDDFEAFSTNAHSFNVVKVKITLGDGLTKGNSAVDASTRKKSKNRREKKKDKSGMDDNISAAQVGGIDEPVSAKKAKKRRRREDVGALAAAGGDVGLLSLKAVHSFLWNKKDNLQKISQTTYQTIPPLWPCDSDAADQEDHDNGPTTFEYYGFDLTKIEGFISNDNEESILQPNFFVRDEYKEFDHFIQNPPSKQSGNILLVGHPGIGKTVWFTYTFLHCLAEGKRTVLLLGEEKRYMAIEEGVFSLPTETNRLRQTLYEHYADDALTLYDLARSQFQVDTALFVWRTIVSSSPCRERYQEWEKRSVPRKFVMKPWSWSEIYVARGLSRFERTDDEWRDVFIKFGGSAQNLYMHSTSKLEMDAKQAVDRIEPPAYYVGESSFNNDLSYRIIMARPSRNNGTVNRGRLVVCIISSYIISLLQDRRAAQINENLVEKLRTSVFHDCVAAPGDDFIFEGYGHSYVLHSLRQRSVSLRRLPLSNSTSIDDESRPLTIAEREGERFHEDVDPTNLDSGYYRPAVPSSAGIDAFLVTKPTSTEKGTIILFKFTLENRHDIRSDCIRKWWKNGMQGWSWKLVFVVPNREAKGLSTPQGFKPALTEEMRKKIDQYVCAIDMLGMRDFVGKYNS